MTTAKCEVATAEAMKSLGARLAEAARPGDLIVLTGDLGAGKTTLTQGLGAALGITEPITSPTFVIARVHQGGRIPLVHVDAYRLASLAEVDDLDLDADLGDSVTVIEWGEGLVEQLSEDRLVVAIHRGTEDEVRRVELTGFGERWNNDEVGKLAGDADA